VLAGRHAVFAPSWALAPPPKTTARVYALPPLTKLDPVTGKGRGDTVAKDVAQGNPLWNAAGKQAVLDTARGEITSFQLVVDGPVSKGRLRLTGFPAASSGTTRSLERQGRRSAFSATGRSEFGVACKIPGLRATAGCSRWPVGRLG